MDKHLVLTTNNLEKSVATELAAPGVPKDRIVLAFYQPTLHEMGEFAVA